MALVYDGAHLVFKTAGMGPYVKDVVVTHTHPDHVSWLNPVGSRFRGDDGALGRERRLGDREA